MSQLLPIFEFTAEQTRKLAAEQTVAEAPIVIGDVTIVPISTLSCGFSCGGSDLTKRADGVLAGAGGKVKRTPLTYLAVCGSDVRLLQVEAAETSKGGLLSALTPLVAQFKDKLTAKKVEKSDHTEQNGAAE